ncbi:hypothetical protein DFH28DRAFT_1155458 [Melampsora americana]|nr:hypothetical protein DFH28DRAFT_1155458 [Melampsora americana]
MSPPMVELVVSLICKFERLFAATYPTDCDMDPSDVFDCEEAWQIVKNASAVSNGEFLRAILGGGSLPGLYETIKSCITTWYKSQVYLDHRQELEDQQVILDQEILNEQLIEEEICKQLRLKQVERDEKAARIQAAKKLRLEKQAEKMRNAEEEKDRRRREQSFK